MYPVKFLSTLSLRRATRLCAPRCARRDDFYPRSPCGERHLTPFCTGIFIGDFYPRSPCGERQSQEWYRHKSSDFYPRSPCGERLIAEITEAQSEAISIHALLAESDPQAIYPSSTPPKFLSTLSLRRATAPNRRSCHCNRNFYPRSPCGERLPSTTRRLTNLMISIHALLAESDSKSAQNSGALLRI